MLHGDLVGFSRYKRFTEKDKQLMMHRIDFADREVCNHSEANV